MTDPDLTVGAVLTDDLRDWLMAELRYPVIAVIAEDGSPSQSVMWFDLDPEDPNVIVMNTKRGRAKDRWLRRDPRISLCFEEGLRWAAFKGQVTLDDDPRARHGAHPLPRAPLRRRSRPLRGPGTGHPALPPGQGDPT